MGQGYDVNDRMITDTFPIESLDDIQKELNKPDVEYVKVFMHNGKPSIEKEITTNEALLLAVSGDLDDLNKMADDMVSKMDANG